MATHPARVPSRLLARQIPVSDMTKFNRPDPPSSQPGGPSPQPETAGAGPGNEQHPDEPANNAALLGEIDRLVAGHHHDPHSILGAHQQPDDASGSKPVTVR